MNKQQFLAAIEKRLEGIPQEDLQESLDYYEEMLNDRIDDGMSEEAAVQDMGSVDEITAQILSESALCEPEPATVSKTDANPAPDVKARSARALRAWEIVLIVLGAPLWIPLLAAGFAVAVALSAVAVSLFAVVWILVGVLYLVVLSLGLAAFAGIGAGVALLFSAGPAAALLAAGVGLVCAGLAILLFLGSNLVAATLAKGTARLFRAIFAKKKNKQKKENNV